MGFETFLAEEGVHHVHHAPLELAVIGHLHIILALPCLSKTFIRRLWDARKGLGVIPVTQECLHPLAALYHRASLSLLETAYEEWQYTLRHIVSDPQFVTLEVPNPEVLRNINRPSEL